MVKHSRDRSPKRKDKRDRDYDRHDSGRRHDRDHKSSKSSKREIDAHKKGMASRLSSAISDVKRMDQAESSEATQSNYDYPLTVSETLKRNTQLERIEESGFVPASFISSRSGKKSQAEQKIDDHESAVFGAAWKSKELTKKLAKQENVRQSAQPILSSMSSGMKLNADFSDFPLAQTWLNTDPEERQQKWLKTFLDQRRQLFDGVL